MTQYKDRVEAQRRLLKAEELADNIMGIQVHSINYLSGKIERTLHDGTKIVLVEAATGDDLVHKVEASLTDSGKTL